MKQCLKCGRFFEDESLRFCRSDGSLLISASPNEATTGFLPVVAPALHSTHGLPESTSSVAVLPFTSLTDDSADDYFCVGLAEEIVHALCRIENLRVVAPTSAFSFKDKQIDVREIGRTLNVDVVLEGRIRRANNKMRLTVQLVS